MKGRPFTYLTLAKAQGLHISTGAVDLYTDVCTDQNIPVQVSEGKKGRGQGGSYRGWAMHSFSIPERGIEG